MPEEQLSSLLAKLKEDAVLREKLQGAGDLDAAVALAKEAGFDVSKADWLKYQAKQTLELSDEELELEELAGVAGGMGVPNKSLTNAKQNKAKIWSEEPPDNFAIDIDGYNCRLSP